MVPSKYKRYLATYILKSFFLLGKDCKVEVDFIKSYE